MERQQFLVLFLVFSVVLLTLIPAVKADVGDTGWFGSKSIPTFTEITQGTWAASPYSLNVDANITAIALHGNTYNNNIKVFIYSLDGQTCYYHSDAVSWSAYEWYNITGLNVQLHAGTYLMGMRSSYQYTRFYRDSAAGNSQNGSVAINAPWGSLSAAYTNYNFAIYANYTEATIDTGEVTSQMISTDWLTFGGLVFLSILDVIFVLKSRNYLLNFIFGAVTFGAGAYFLGTDMILSGWINLLALIMGIICMADAIVIWEK